LWFEILIQGLAEIFFIRYPENIAERSRLPQSGRLLSFISRKLDKLKLKKTGNKKTLSAIIREEVIRNGLD